MVTARDTCKDLHRGPKTYFPLESEVTQKTKIKGLSVHPTDCQNSAIETFQMSNLP